VLTLVSPADDTNNNAPPSEKRKERSDWIRASNVIQQGNNGLGNGVVYHAGNFVELLPGFEAVTGAHFAAYPEGCTGNFMYRDTPLASPSDRDVPLDVIPEEIHLIRVGNGFTLVPNPAQSWVEIAVDEGEFAQIQVTTIDGKSLMAQSITATQRHRLDVQAYPNGIYMVSIVLTDGTVIAEKLVKN
jgi:hypothetical protein